MNYKDYKILESDYLSIVDDYMYDILGKCQMLLSRLSINREFEIEHPILSDETKYLEKLSILSRGIVICSNFNNREMKIPFLLTGINPYFSVNEIIYPWKSHNYSLQSETNPLDEKRIKKHWNDIKKQFGDLCNSMEYLDLFPLREGDQKKLVDVFKYDNFFGAD